MSKFCLFLLAALVGLIHNPAIATIDDVAETPRISTASLGMKKTSASRAPGKRGRKSIPPPSTICKPLAAICNLCRTPGVSHGRIAVPSGIWLALYCLKCTRQQRAEGVICVREPDGTLSVSVITSSPLLTPLLGRCAVCVRPAVCGPAPDPAPARGGSGVAARCEVHRLPADADLRAIRCRCASAAAAAAAVAVAPPILSGAVSEDRQTNSLEQDLRSTTLSAAVKDGAARPHDCARSQTVSDCRFARLSTASAAWQWQHKRSTAIAAQ
jgi:hypothetical protein